MIAKILNVRLVAAVACCLFFCISNSFAADRKCVKGHWEGGMYKLVGYKTGNCNSGVCRQEPIFEWQPAVYVCDEYAKPESPAATPSETPSQTPSGAAENCSYDYDLVFNPPWCDQYGCSSTRKGTLECSEGVTSVRSEGIGTLDCASCLFTRATDRNDDTEAEPTQEKPVVTTPPVAEYPAYVPSYSPSPSYCPSGNCPWR